MQLLLKLVDVNIRDSKHGVSLLMSDCAFIILSPLLLDNADHLALGLLDDCGLDVEQTVVDIGLSTKHIVFASEFSHLVQLEHIAYRHVLESVDSDEIILGNEQRATCYFCNGIETHLVSKFADGLFGCIVDSSGMK